MTRQPAALNSAVTAQQPSSIADEGSRMADSESIDQALARAQRAAQAKRLHEALGICEDVLVTSPHKPAALALKGIVTAMIGDSESGVTLLLKAIQREPGHATWYSHLSSLCRATNRIEEAFAAGQEAVRLDPNNPESLVNLSLILLDRDDRDGAMACLLRAIGLRHDYADAHLAMAQNLLAMGNFDSGWIEYEWRNRTEAAKGTIPAITSAPWNGMPIPAGRLLLVGDQGYGDTIQFARYIPLAAQRCQELILGCSAELRPLLENIPGVSRYYHRWTDIPGHAAHCRLSSLPYLFRSQIDTIPQVIPYLKADPSRIAHWRERLAGSLSSDTRRIGLAWTGRPTHPNDRRRSVALSKLASLADAGSVSFVSLQKPMPPRDMEAISLFPGMTDLSNELTDFGETAALIENLDLMITVDSSVAHLAGGLGKPVWLLIPKVADWRWLLDREDSPWYPTARLFRQRKIADWDEPIANLRSALNQWLNAAPHPCGDRFTGD